jgi:hypothetical protein
LLDDSILDTNDLGYITDKPRKKPSNKRMPTDTGPNSRILRIGSPHSANMLDPKEYGIKHASPASRGRAHRCSSLGGERGAG